MPKTASRFYPNISKAVFLLLDFNKAVLLTWSWGKGFFFFFGLGWGRRGCSTGSHRRRTGREGREGGVAPFFSPFSLGSRKERKEAKAKRRSPSRARRDGWLGEGLPRERRSLVGCASLPGWIDLARVELHHLPCISLFFSQPGEVDSLGRAQYFPPASSRVCVEDLLQRITDNKTNQLR